MADRRLVIAVKDAVECLRVGRSKVARPDTADEVLRRALKAVGEKPFDRRYLSAAKKGRGQSDGR